MSPTLFRGILAAALAATLIAAYFAPPASDGEVIPVARTGKGGATVVAESSGKRSGDARREESDDVQAIQLRILPEEFVPVFQTVRWAPEAPSEKKAVASVESPSEPPPPSAPPLPFKMLGRYVEDDTEIVFLQYKDQSVAVQVGDLIDDLYRVENLVDGVLTLRYVPLGEKQTLAVGGIN